MAAGRGGGECRASMRHEEMQAPNPDTQNTRTPATTETRLRRVAKGPAPELSARHLTSAQRNGRHPSGAHSDPVRASRSEMSPRRGCRAPACGPHAPPCARPRRGSGRRLSPGTSGRGKGDRRQNAPCCSSEDCSRGSGVQARGPRCLGRACQGRGLWGPPTPRPSRTPRLQSSH